jgi:hypothetical protein
VEEAPRTNRTGLVTGIVSAVADENEVKRQAQPPASG